MIAAILSSTLPPDLRDSCLQQADKCEEYGPTKEKIASIVATKLAMESPDDMEVDALQWQEWGEKGLSGKYNEDLQALGKASIR